MDKDMHIYSIRKKLGITPKSISDYNQKNGQEIENIGSIFSLKGTNKKKVLALLYLFAPDENDDVIQKYRNATGLHEAIYNSSDTHITEYYIMLLAALYYNSAFYAMALNYYGAISAGFPIRGIEEEPDTQVFPSRASNFKSSYSDGYIWIDIITIERTEHFSIPLSTTRGARTTEDFSAMISEYAQKIEANPNDYDAYIMRGLAYYKDGEYPDALKDFQTAVPETNTQGMEGIYYAMGRCYYEIGEDDKAIEFFRKIKAIDPEFADINEILKEPKE